MMLAQLVLGVLDGLWYLVDFSVVSLYPLILQMLFPPLSRSSRVAFKTLEFIRQSGKDLSGRDFSGAYLRWAQLQNRCLVGPKF